MRAFFYSTSTPYLWSSGPVMSTLDPNDGWTSIPSLERAKEIAESEDTGYIGDDTVVASYGVIYDLIDDPVEDDTEDDSGYELDDPKHPGYHDSMSDFWDFREGK